MSEHETQVWLSPDGEAWHSSKYCATQELSVDSTPPSEIPDDRHPCELCVDPQTRFSVEQGGRERE